MKIKKIQNIIDSIRGKNTDYDYFVTLYMANLLIRSGLLCKDFSQKLKQNRTKPLYFAFAKKKIGSILKNTSASKLAIANGKMRSFQLKIVDFAKLLIPKLEKEGLHPMLSGGSLIGAIRHNSHFIPWDDDLDFDLMIDEYEKLKEYAKNNFLLIDMNFCKNFNEQRAIIDYALKVHPNQIIFSQKPSCMSAYIGTSLEDCMTLDFFPRYYLNPQISKKNYVRYAKESVEKVKTVKNWNKYFNLAKKETKRGDIYFQKSHLTAYGWNNEAFVYRGKVSFLPLSDIYPYKRIKFEGFEFYTMNDVDKYLKDFYGDYMRMPENIDFAIYISIYSKFLKSRNRKYYIGFEELAENI